MEFLLAILYLLTMFLAIRKIRSLEQERDNISTLSDAKGRIIKNLQEELQKSVRENYQFKGSIEFLSELLKLSGETGEKIINEREDFLNMLALAEVAAHFPEETKEFLDE
jgi:tRNA U34 5-carboxymethylaminomethyl modifying GTPase MnmE/TrmE